MRQEYRKSSGRKKRYIVKSKFRFITAVVIMMAMIIGTATAVIGIGSSTALTKHECATEYVNSGETLWSIANEYKSDDTDVRKAVYEICKVNDIKADQLQAGMTLIIPDTI